MEWTLNTEVDTNVENENESEYSCLWGKVMDPFRLLLMTLLATYVYVKKIVLPNTCPSRCASIKLRGVATTVPKRNSFLVDGMSKRCRHIRDGSGRWPALDIILRYHLLPSHSISNCLDNFWLNIKNARAVRNRDDNMTTELVNAIRRSHTAHGEVRIASIAYGSFEAVLAAVKIVFKEDCLLPLSVTYLDIDTSTLQQAQKRIHEEGLESIITTRRIMFLKRSAIQTTLQDLTPTIVEMGGLFDHIEETHIHTLVGEVYDILPERGYFITAHIHDNFERFFMEQVLEWIMYYRSLEELRRLTTIGLAWRAISPLTEPEGIHSIITCIK